MRPILIIIIINNNQNKCELNTFFAKDNQCNEVDIIEL